MRALFFGSEQRKFSEGVSIPSEIQTKKSIIIYSAISKFLMEHPLLYDMGETYFFNRHYAQG